MFAEVSSLRGLAGVGRKKTVRQDLEGGCSAAAIVSVPASSTCHHGTEVKQGEEMGLQLSMFWSTPGFPSQRWVCLV